MKKILVLLAVAFLATSCGFKSKETPIKGTDLVTFTVEKSDKLGVKEPGETGNIIRYAEFYSIEAYVDYLWVKKEKDADFDILSKTGKELYSSVTVFEEGNNYRIIKWKNRKCYVSGETGKISVPYKELYVVQVNNENYIFNEVENWGVTIDGRTSNILSNEYDKIIILSSEQGKKLQFIGHQKRSYNDKTWIVAVKQDEYRYSSSSHTDKQINELTKGASIKWSQGPLAVYEK